MNKPELRKKYNQLRANLSMEEIENQSIKIANLILQLPIWQNTYFHLFLTIKEKKEINTEYILAVLQGKNKEIVLSKSNFETFEMRNFLLTENTKIKTNSYGIPEPYNGIEIIETKIEVVFVPLLAYDLKGNRVGYGKGFYDRFLIKCNKNVIKIGLSFFEPELEIPSTIHDKHLEFVVTPNKIYNLSGL